MWLQSGAAGEQGEGVPSGDDRRHALWQYVVGEGTAARHLQHR